jgi:hypothetical protein
MVVTGKSRDNAGASGGSLSLKLSASTSPGLAGPWRGGAGGRRGALKKSCVGGAGQSNNVCSAVFVS